MRSTLSHGLIFARPRAAPACSRVRRALTLPELLVVTGVIGMLMAILLPVLGSVQRSSRAVACASNLRGLGTAHQMYMRDNREDFVPAGLSHGGAPGDPRNSWLTRLPAYMTSHGALRSPVDRSPYWSVDDGGSHQGMTLTQAIAHLQSNPGAMLPSALISRWSSYGLNVMLTDMFNGYPKPGAGGTQWLKWTHLHAVPRPQNTVHFLMMTDGTGIGDPAFARTDHADTHMWVNLPPFKQAIEPEKVGKQMQMHAHGGRAGTWPAVANYGFLDGHVETLAFNVVYENKTRNRFLPIAQPSN